jgi:excinuclease ABC subunit A
MSYLTICGARLHNLKNVTLAIPKNKLVVFSGLSGSGKSTLAFDTLHREGQRQYMESLGIVGHANRPPIDAILGLSPSISVGQELTNRSPRSTVGTATEVYTFLRVLFARAGHRPCPRCGGDVPPSFEAAPSHMASAWDEGANELAEDDAALVPQDAGGEAGEDLAVTCPHCGARLPEMTMALFSFNKPAGACPTCTGLGTVYMPDLARLLDDNKSIRAGAVTGWDIHTITRYEGTLRNAGKHYGFEFDTALPLAKLGAVQRDLLLYGVRGRPFQARFPGVEPPPTVAKGYFEGVVTNLLRRRTEHADDPDYVEKIDQL